MDCEHWVWRHAKCCSSEFAAVCRRKESKHMQFSATKLRYVGTRQMLITVIEVMKWYT